MPVLGAEVHLLKNVVGWLEACLQVADIKDLLWWYFGKDLILNAMR